MQRYRIAFFVLLVLTVLLAGALAFLWLNPEAFKARMASSLQNQAPPKAASSPASDILQRTTPVRSKRHGTEPRARYAVRLSGCRASASKPGRWNLRRFTTRSEPPATSRWTKRGWPRCRFGFQDGFRRSSRTRRTSKCEKGSRCSPFTAPSWLRRNTSICWRSKIASSCAKHGSRRGLGSRILLSSATERLRQWEIPDREIEELEQSGKVEARAGNRLAGIRAHHGTEWRFPTCTCSQEPSSTRSRTFNSLGVRPGLPERHRANQGGRLRDDHRGLLSRANVPRDG